MSTIIAGLAQRILGVREDKAGPTIAAIGGAADLGKSHLARQLVGEFQRRGYSADVFALDSFLIDRATRKSRGLSGYDLEAYDLDQAVGTLAGLSRGETIEYHPYDHQQGARSATGRTMPPPEILVFEGLFALAEVFAPQIQVAFFVYTDDAQLIRIRSAADLSKRGYTREYSQHISQSELERYKNNVEPLRLRADFRLRLIRPWEYEIENSRD